MRAHTRRRTPIPSRIQHEILFRNQSVCCVCQKSGVQIHHIDGNPANNSFSNLCILCIEHHAEASSKSNMVKALSPTLLMKYKAEWEGRLARKRQLRAFDEKVESMIADFQDGANQIQRPRWGKGASDEWGSLIPMICANVSLRQSNPVIPELKLLRYSTSL